MAVGKKSRIPRFASHGEEAAFWDTHSLAEFEDELEVVKVKIARPLEHHLSIRLDAKVLTELASLSARVRVGPSTLARVWLMERLAQELKKIETTETVASGGQVPPRS